MSTRSPSRERLQEKIESVQNTFVLQWESGLLIKRLIARKVLSLCEHKQLKWQYKVDGPNDAAQYFYSIFTAKPDAEIDILFEVLDTFQQEGGVSTITFEAGMLHELLCVLT